MKGNVGEVIVNDQGYRCEWMEDSEDPDGGYWVPIEEGIQVSESDEGSDDSAGTVAGTKSGKKRDPRTRGFCFTINNYGEDEESILAALYESGEVDYIIYGREAGKKKGTPHLQGFLYIKNKRLINSVREFLPKGSHVEGAKGTHVEALIYCMKENNYVEYGDRPRQGKRSDLDVIRYDIERGKSDYEIALQYFPQWCQYRRAFAEYRELMNQNKKHDTILYLYTLDNPKSCAKLATIDRRGKRVLDMRQDYSFVWVEYMSGKWDIITCPDTGIDYQPSRYKMPEDDDSLYAGYNIKIL